MALACAKASSLLIWFQSIEESLLRCVKITLDCMVIDHYELPKGVSRRPSTKSHPRMLYSTITQHEAEQLKVAWRGRKRGRRS